MWAFVHQLVHDWEFLLWALKGPFFFRATQLGVSYYYKVMNNVIVDLLVIRRRARGRIARCEWFVFLLVLGGVVFLSSAAHGAKSRARGGEADCYPTARIGDISPLTTPQKKHIETLIGKILVKSGEEFSLKKYFHYRYKVGGARASILPAQGWKLHYQPPLQDLENAVATVVEVMKQHPDLEYKIIAPKKAWMTMEGPPVTHDKISNNVYGKFFTFYVEGDASTRMAELLKQLSGELKKNGVSAGGNVPPYDCLMQGYPGFSTRYGVHTAAVGLSGRPIALDGIDLMFVKNQDGTCQNLKTGKPTPCQTPASSNTMSVKMVQDYRAGNGPELLLRQPSTCRPPFVTWPPKGLGVVSPCKDSPPLWQGGPLVLRIVEGLRRSGSGETPEWNSFVWLKNSPNAGRWTTFEDAAVYAALAKQKPFLGLRIGAEALEWCDTVMASKLMAIEKMKPAMNDAKANVSKRKKILDRKIQIHAELNESLKKLNSAAYFKELAPKGSLTKEEVVTQLKAWKVPRSIRLWLKNQPSFKTLSDKLTQKEFTQVLEYVLREYTEKILPEEKEKLAQTIRGYETMLAEIQDLEKRIQKLRKTQPKLGRVSVDDMPLCDFWAFQQLPK